MGDITNYRDIIAWEKSVALAVKVYGVTARFPKDG